MAFHPITIPASIGRPFHHDATLNGVNFHLEWIWNPRAKFWTLHFSDAARVPILQGIKGVVDWPLLIRATDERKPVGQLYLRDTSRPVGQGIDPGAYDLGARVQLVFDDEQP